MAANGEAARWCAEVNDAVQSGIAAVPTQRLEQERELLAALPSLRAEGIGARPVSRKVDKLSCVRFGSARYSVPTRLIGASVLVTVTDGQVLLAESFTGEVVAEHALVAPGEVSILDEHYGSSRRTSHAGHRGPRPRPRSGSSPSARSPSSS